MASCDTAAPMRERFDVPISQEFGAFRSAALRDQLLSDLERLTSSAQIDRAMIDAAQASVDGRLSESDYSAVAAALTALRSILPQRKTVAERVPDLAGEWKVAGRSRFKPHVRKRMPTGKKAEYMKRRRELAASGMIPRQIASDFTTGQLAALTIVAQEVAKFGRCSLVIEKIAGLAGVCHATVRRALAAAAEKGLVAVAYRQRRGAPSLSNIVTILSASWRGWIKRRFQGFSMRDMLQKLASVSPASLFLGSSDTKCNPTPSTNNIYGNRPMADYSISFEFDGINALARPRGSPS